MYIVKMQLYFSLEFWIISNTLMSKAVVRVAKKNLFEKIRGKNHERNQTHSCI